MTTPINCPTFPNDRKKEPFDVKLQSKLKGRAKDQEKLYREMRQTPRALGNTANDQFLIQQARELWAKVNGDVMLLNPKQRRQVQDLLVSQFGYMNRMLGLDPSTNYSVAGEVRNTLIESKETIEGLINLSGRIVALGQMQRVLDKYDTIARRVGLKRHVREELLIDLIEVGQSPARRSAIVHYTHEVLGRSTLFDIVERRRYQEFTNRMVSAGFTKDEIDELVSGAVSVSDSFDRVRAIARSVGVDVGDQEGIGYFARIVTEDFKLRYADFSDKSALLDTIDTSITEFSTVHNRSRNTNHFIPEDLDITSEVTGLTRRQIMDMLMEPQVWRRYLHENLSTEQLDLLVDSGVFQKLPMTSREIYEYFVSQYKLPYKWMNEMFIVDPERTLQQYTASLQRAAGNAGMLRRMVEGEAFEQGWAVTRSMRDSNPDLRDFVSLGSQMDNWSKQADATIYDALQLDDQARRLLSDTYVHPIVADQWSALMQISMDPQMMGTVGRTLYYIQRFLNKQVLSNVRYVTNTLLQGVTTSMAAGGNALLHIPAFLHTAKVMTQGLEYFDKFADTRYVVRANGETMSLRQVYEYFLIKSGHNVAPGSNMLRVRGTTRRQLVEGIMSAPESFERAVSHIMSYTFAAGDPVNGQRIPGYERPGRFLRRVGIDVNNILDASFGGFAFAANFVDIAFKWSTLLSILENSNGGRFAVDAFSQVATTGQFRRFDDIDDAIRHINEYFVNPYNTGRTTSFFNNYIRPFSTWAMANPPMQIRHMLRNPHLYVSMMRLRSFWNTPLYTDENYNDDTTSSWILKADPLFMGRDEDGNPIVMITNSWDAGYDFLQWAVQSPGETARGLWGRPTGTEEDRRELARGRRESFESWLLDSAGEANVIWRTVIETYTGRPTFGDKRPFVERDDLDVRPSFLGLQMPPRLINILRKLPLLENLDTLNPGGNFGTPTIYDTQGRVVQRGTPSWAGADRGRIVGRSLDTLGNNIYLRAIRSAGLNVRTIDYGRNARNTIDDIENTMMRLQESINESRVLLESSPTMSEGERQRITQERADKIVLLHQLSMDHARVLQWARDNDVLPNDALRELNNLNIRVRGLQDPNQETINRIIEETLIQNGVMVP